MQIETLNQFQQHLVGVARSLRGTRAAEEAARNFAELNKQRRNEMEQRYDEATTTEVNETNGAPPPKQPEAKATDKPKGKATNGKAKPPAKTNSGQFLVLNKSNNEFKRIAESELQGALADAVKNSDLELVRITVLTPQLSYTEQA
jgi:hypothetical protein